MAEIEKKPAEAAEPKKDAPKPKKDKPSLFSRIIGWFRTTKAELRLRRQKEKALAKA